MQREVVGRGVASMFVAALAVTLVVLLGARPAAAGEADDAKALYQKATGEFGIGDYEQAAAHFEAAFKIRPEPALLYNAAQAYRLAGKNQRALELYKNVVRLYAGSPQATEAKRHVATLSKQVSEARETPSPPPQVPPAPPPAAAQAPVRSPVPHVALAAPTPPNPVTLVAAPSPSAPAPSANHRSIFASPWLWLGVGVALLGTAAIVIAGRPSYPNPSFGSGDAN